MDFEYRPFETISNHSSHRKSTLQPMSNWLKDRLGLYLTIWFVCVQVHYFTLFNICKRKLLVGYILKTWLSIKGQKSKTKYQGQRPWPDSKYHFFFCIPILPRKVNGKCHNRLCQTASYTFIISLSTYQVYFPSIFGPLMPA